MKLVYARWVINQVSGKDYNYIKAWGMSTVRDAIRTIQSRKSATNGDKLNAEILLNNILRKE